MTAHTQVTWKCLVVLPSIPAAWGSASTPCSCGRRVKGKLHIYMQVWRTVLGACFSLCPMPAALPQSWWCWVHVGAWCHVDRQCLERGRGRGVPGRTNRPLVTVLFGLMEVAAPDHLGLPSVKTAVPGVESDSETLPSSSFHRSSTARSPDGDILR